MKNRIQFAALAFGTALLAGCGGGGGSTDPGGSVPTGPTNSFGPIETRGQVNGTAISRDLGRISTVAIAGTFTDATYRPQAVPDNETAILSAGAQTIDAYLENGDFLGSFRPSNVPTGASIGNLVWSNDGSRLYYGTGSGIYYVSGSDLGGAATTVLTATGIQGFAISPDGTQVAYSRVPTGEGDYDVFVRPIAGGSTKKVTVSDDDDFVTAWIDDHRIVVRTFGGNTTVVNVNTFGTESYQPSALNVYPLASARNGRFLLNSGTSDGTDGLSITDLNTGDLSLAFTKDYPLPGQTLSYSASLSPDGQRWAVAGTNLFTTEVAPKTVHLVAPDFPQSPGSAAWQPALGITKFVGSGGKIGSASSGIIATHRSGAGRNGLSSFVNWDAQTRTTSTVSDDSTDSGVGSKTYTIEADRLTALRYAHRPFFTPVSVVSASGTANGAFVTIDAEKGIVTSIVVTQETRGAGKASLRKEGAAKVIEGRILSVWNEKGKNLAPNGATRVVLPASGEPQL